jgi:hypothetical protein
MVPSCGTVAYSVLRVLNYRCLSFLQCGKLEDLNRFQVRPRPAVDIWLTRLFPPHNSL